MPTRKTELEIISFMLDKTNGKPDLFHRQACRRYNFEFLLRP